MHCCETRWEIHVFPWPGFVCLLVQEFKQLYDMPNPYSEKPGAGGLDSARKSNGDASKPKQVGSAPFTAPCLDGGLEADLSEG